MTGLSVLVDRAFAAETFFEAGLSLESRDRRPGFRILRTGLSRIKVYRGLGFRIPVTGLSQQERNYCAARNRYNLAPYVPCGAQRYTRSSAGLQAGLVQGPRKGPLYPPSLESICRGLETHVRPQDAIRNT